MAVENKVIKYKGTPMTKYNIQRHLHTSSNEARESKGQIPAAGMWEVEGTTLESGLENLSPQS